jgi:glycosyltransferase involved in cell wall biosynthesis
MLISVVVPSYNQAEFLDATLRSLVEQDHAEKEILVMDGGSTDGSVDIIRRYADQLAFWVSERDGGQSQAIANGKRRCRGELVGWLNSDDVLKPGALSRVAAAARGGGTTEAVFYGGHDVIDERGRVMDVAPAFEDTDWCRRRLGPVICQPGTFYGRAAYERLGGVDTSLHYGMDMDLWMRFFAAGMPFVRVPGYQASFRRHSQQKGHNREALRQCDIEEAAMRQRYGLAVQGTARYRIARNVRRTLGLLSGSLVVTLAFRLANRGTLSEYHPSYS